MKPAKIASLLTLLLILAGTLSAAVKYGEAVLEKGKMTIIRENRELNIDQVDFNIVINVGDLIRLWPKSRVTLRSLGKATIRLGPNAIFRVKPWKSRGKKGVFRMLFGRFRTFISGLGPGKRYDAKTTAATIGVKGTEYRAYVTYLGDTLLIVTKGTVGFQGRRGPEQNVGESFMSLAVNIDPATPPVAIPPDVLAEIERDGLDAPLPNDPAARNFGLEEIIPLPVLPPEDVESALPLIPLPDYTFDRENGSRNFGLSSSPENIGTGCIGNQGGGQGAGKCNKP